ncbi:1,3-beta-D-glucan synthase [Apophysomyces sp. BC1034]|nr:1,3-beta-D-glucan synthase [Apophysomyces sp. BC1015]KAG0186617.1 1,3-beta-D-glucan synthase [Apophysomyces sp. BC1034]
MPDADAATSSSGTSKQIDNSRRPDNTTHPPGGSLPILVKNKEEKESAKKNKQKSSSAILYTNNRTELIQPQTDPRNSRRSINVLDSLISPDEGRYSRYDSSVDFLRASLDRKQFTEHTLHTHDALHTSPPAGKRKSIFTEFSNNHRNTYPSWNSDDAVPMTDDDIRDELTGISHKLGFQRDNTANMYEHLMMMLDSRSSRMSPQLALDTLHAEYIGGEGANYRRWYFAARMYLIDKPKFISDKNKGTEEEIHKEETEDERHTTNWETLEVDEAFRIADERWKLRMRALSNKQKVCDLSLYLLIWGEAASVRFIPEALCFLYKVANDYLSHGAHDDGLEENTFLNDIITPLYQFVRDQLYDCTDGRLVKREKDHHRVIGYDDVNEFFWDPACLDKIPVSDTTLMKLEPGERYLSLKHVNWKKVFRKTYKEKRSWMHISINFSRVWIIHIVSFWYYIGGNAGAIYLSADPEVASLEQSVQWSVAALGGAIAALLMFVGSIAEYTYLPASWANTGVMMKRMGWLSVLLVLNAGPTVYCVFIDRQSAISKIVAALQLVISIATTLYLAITPPARLFQWTSPALTRHRFTANFPPLKKTDSIMSIGMWLCVFACKLIESYFFLALSFKDPLKVISKMSIVQCNDAILGSLICRQMPLITLALMFLMDLILYFLDTYLWYVIWNTTFSVARSFYLGISIWSPWRNIFSRLPIRIFVKLLATAHSEVSGSQNELCAQVWNAIVIAMYREHLLTMEQTEKILYQQTGSVSEGDSKIKPPPFFISQEDTAFKTEYFPRGGEAERRMHFFAQSLTTPMPQPQPVESMPSFTVLTPHYGEKILLSLREIIREENQNTRVTMLDYLKTLHKPEWENFVREAKSMIDDIPANSSQTVATRQEPAKGYDTTFYCIGFKSVRPETTARTRIWASLRAQTLYRTITGFMNYRAAIRLMYRVENAEAIQNYRGDNKKLQQDLNQLTNSKFRFLVAMQRYAQFNEQEREDTEFLLTTYPELQIAYVDEEKPEGEGGGASTFYSALIDGHCELLPDGKRKPKYRIRLPGTPILGDGKSDNQNHALIFYRGEFLQLIDANQDNYLEECLKIRNVLAEFETLEPSDVSPYAQAYANKQTSPVAIVGAREYIFSENIGVLGDIAAGKEQTFGTLTQRIMAKIGGKLHYGHPDFLNAVFMTTRGGVSKAQKGLHLNEDIYAGMNAFIRGGRIKHTEYFQCGKGRDLGFQSILNFTTKIGTGMGEQMLSREYYYIGTQLRLDRFLTFYYAHPGFHINNIFIMLSVQMFMLVILFINAMGSTLLVCDHYPDAPPEAPLTPAGCYDMVPILEWVKRCILSIFVVFMVAFLPLFLQELTERGLLRSLTRLGRHFICLSPLFEIFVTRIYTNSVLDNLVYGGAQYIATGRGFATTRVSFAVLYSMFAVPSIYVGARNLLIMTFASVAVWIPHLFYFWFTVVALIISPFVFNPHQFAIVDFLVDYGEFLRWLSRGNSKIHRYSWIDHIRSMRTRITGHKRVRQANDTSIKDIPRTGFTAWFFPEIVMPLFYAVLCLIPYLFVKSFDPDDPTQPNTSNHSGLLRIAALSVAPILLNAVALVIFGFVSLLLGCILGLCCNKFGSFVAALAHGWAVINLIVCVEALMFLEEWHTAHIVLGLVSMAALQRFILRAITIPFLTREFKIGQSNVGWWTGKWYGRGLGWYVLSQPFREYLCKIAEMSEFAIDFILGHFILFFLFIFCLVPYADRVHSHMLFWLKLGNQVQKPFLPPKERRKRKWLAVTYGILFVAMFILFTGLLAAPLAFGNHLKFINPRKLPI